MTLHHSTDRHGFHVDHPHCAQCAPSGPPERIPALLIASSEITDREFTEKPQLRAGVRIPPCMLVSGDRSAESGRCLLGVGAARDTDAPLSQRADLEECVCALEQAVEGARVGTPGGEVQPDLASGVEAETPWPLVPAPHLRSDFWNLPRSGAVTVHATVTRSMSRPPHFCRHGGQRSEGGVCWFSYTRGSGICGRFTWRARSRPRRLGCARPERPAGRGGVPGWPPGSRPPGRERAGRRTPAVADDGRARRPHHRSWSRESSSCRDVEQVRGGAPLSAPPLPVNPL